MFFSDLIEFFHFGWCNLDFINILTSHPFQILKLIPRSKIMPDLLSYFSPRKLLSMSPTRCSQPQVDEAMKEENEFSSDNIVIETGLEETAEDSPRDVTADEGDVAGILNENFENCCGHAIDLSSVESLSVALFKLESEKETLENEISDQYDTISFGDLETIVNKLITVSRVETESSMDQEEVNENFELLKSTALFVEKRLRKMRENKKRMIFEEKVNMMTRETAEVPQQCVTSNDGSENQDISEDVEIETVTNVDFATWSTWSNKSLDKAVILKEDSESATADHQEESYQVSDDVSEEVTDKNEDDPEQEIVDRDNELFQKLSVKEEDDIEDTGSTGSNSESFKSNKNRFGLPKTRMSLKRVFKKKSLTTK